MDHRWKVHVNELIRGSHHNRRLQNAWNKYGDGCFKFYVLEECEVENLDDRETFWINNLGSFENGYNLDFGGKGTRGYKHTDEEIEKMRKVQDPNEVLQFDLNFNLINTWNGVSHVAKSLGYTRENIERCCLHCGLNISYKDFYWVYSKEYFNENFTWENYLNKKASIKIGRKNSGVNSKVRKIAKYDLDKNFIEEFPSITDAAFSNCCSTSNIYTAAKGFPRKSSHGFRWKFVD